MFRRACGRHASTSSGGVCRAVVCSGSLGWVAGCGCWSEVREVEGRRKRRNRDVGMGDACVRDDCAVCGYMEDKKEEKSWVR